VASLKAWRRLNACSVFDCGCFCFDLKGATVTHDGLFVIASLGNRCLQIHGADGAHIRSIPVRDPHNPIQLRSGMLAVVDCGENDGE
jgi:hypothetical protein